MMNARWESLRSGASALGFCATMVAFASGCSSYVRVESRLVESQRDPAPEVTSTPAYTASLPKITNVAVRAPDQCINQSASSTTGKAEGTASVLHTQCGVEMAEIERALTKAGYVVTSWRDLNVLVSGADKLSAKAAAQKLGAQVLFQVNSLEKVKIQPGQDARWERKFEKSSDGGVTAGPAELPDKDIVILRGLLAESEKHIVDRVRLGAMLDVDAVMVDSGQTIWFYRWAKAQPASKDNTVTMLARHDGEMWVPTTAQKAPEEATTMVRSGEVEAISNSGKAADQEEVIYFDLVRSVIKNFATSFKFGHVLAD